MKVINKHALFLYITRIFLWKNFCVSFLVSNKSSSILINVIDMSLISSVVVIGLTVAIEMWMKGNDSEIGYKWFLVIYQSLSAVIQNTFFSLFASRLTYQCPLSLQIDNTVVWLAYCVFSYHFLTPIQKSLHYFIQVSLCLFQYYLY